MLKLNLNLVFYLQNSTRFGQATKPPSHQAKNYLRSLITDNRDGERAGFGKAVLSEILLLIALLETRQDFN